MQHFKIARENGTVRLAVRGSLSCETHASKKSFDKADWQINECRTYDTYVSLRIFSITAFCNLDRRNYLAASHARSAQMRPVASDAARSVVCVCLSVCVCWSQGLAVQKRLNRSRCHSPMCVTMYQMRAAN